MNVALTVDLVRTRAKHARWHVVRLPDRATTVCQWQIPDDAIRENELDVHVVAHRGHPVCVHCRQGLK